MSLDVCPMGLADASKGPPTQSSSSERRTSLYTEGRMSPMDLLFEIYEMRKLKRTEPGSSLVVIESTIPASEMLVTKPLLNSVVSTRNAKFMNMDI